MLVTQLGIITNIDDVFSFCRYKIECDEMSISYYTYCDNSAILESITPEYKNHKNIKFVKREKK